MSYMSGKTPVNPKRTMTAQLRALGNTVAVLATVFMVLLVAFVWMLTAISKQSKSKSKTETTATTTVSESTSDTSATDTTETEPETEATTAPAEHASFPEGTKLIALTFDDGPDKCTPQILDTLEREGVVATFFMIGQNVSGTDAALLQRMESLGCELGNHTWAHKTLTKLSEEEAYEQLQKCDKAIEEKVGHKATVIRPPEGAGLLQDGLFKYSRDNKEYVVNWDDVSCPADWQKPARGDAEYTANHVVSNATDGVMVLLHDSYQSTADALPAIIQGLKDKGYTFVTVSQLLEARSAELGLTADAAIAKGYDTSLVAEAYPGGPVYGVRYAYSASKMIFEVRKKG